MFKRKHEQHDKNKTSHLRVTSKIMSFIMLLASTVGAAAPAVGVIGQSALADTRQVDQNSSSNATNSSNNDGSNNGSTQKQEQTSQTSQSDNDSKPVYGGAANVKSDDSTTDAQPNAPNTPMTANSRERQKIMDDLAKGDNSAYGKWKTKQYKSQGIHDQTSKDAAKVDTDQMAAVTREGYENAKKNNRLMTYHLKTINADVPMDGATQQMFLTNKQLSQLAKVSDKKQKELKGLKGDALAKKAKQIDYIPDAGTGGDSEQLAKALNDYNDKQDNQKKSSNKKKVFGVSLGTVIQPFTNLFRTQTAKASTLKNGEVLKTTIFGTHYFAKGDGSLQFQQNNKAVPGSAAQMMAYKAGGFKQWAQTEYRAKNDLTFCIEPEVHTLGHTNGTIKAMDKSVVDNSSSSKWVVEHGDQVPLYKYFEYTMSMHDSYPQAPVTPAAVVEAELLAEAMIAYYTSCTGALSDTVHSVDDFARLFVIQVSIWALVSTRRQWTLNTQNISGQHVDFNKTITKLLWNNDSGATGKTNYMPGGVGMIAAPLQMDSDVANSLPTVSIGQSAEKDMNNGLDKKHMQDFMNKTWDPGDIAEPTKVNGIKFVGGNRDGQDASQYVDVKLEVTDEATNYHSVLHPINPWIVTPDYQGGYKTKLIVTPKQNFPEEANVEVTVVKSVYRNNLGNPLIYVVDNAGEQNQFHADFVQPTQIQTSFHVIPYRYANVKAHKTLTMSGTEQQAIVNKLGMKSGYTADQIKQLTQKIKLQDATFQLQTEDGTPVKWSDPVMSKASVDKGSKAGDDTVDIHPDENGDVHIKALRTTGNDAAKYKLVEIKTPDHTNRTAKVLDFSIGGQDAATDPDQAKDTDAGEFQDDVHYTGITGKKHEVFGDNNWTTAKGMTHLEGAEYTLFYGDDTFGKKDQPVDPSDLAAAKLTKSDDSRVRTTGGRITLITDSNGNLPAIDNLLDYDNTSYYLVETKAAKGLHLDNHLYYFGSGAKDASGDNVVKLNMDAKNTDIQNNTDISASYETSAMDSGDAVKRISNRLEKREEYLGTDSPFEKTHRGTWGSSDGHTYLDFNKVTPYYISNEKPWNGVKNLGSTHKEDAVYGLFYAADSTDGTHKKGQPVKWSDDVASLAKVTDGTKIDKDYTTGTGKKISAGDINIRLSDDHAKLGISDLAYQQYYWKEVDAPAGTALDSKEYIFGADKEQTPTYTQNDKAKVQVDEMETRQDKTPSTTDVNSNFYWDNTYDHGKPYGSTNYVLTFGFNSTKGVETSNGQSPLRALGENGVKLTLKPIDGTQGPDFNTTTFSRTVRDNNGDTKNVKGYFEFRTIPIGTWYLTSDNSNADKTADGTTDATANMQPMIIKMSRDSDNNNYTLSFYTDTNRNKKFDGRDREVARYSSAKGDFMPTQTVLDDIPGDQIQDGYGAGTQPGEDVYEGENHVWSRPNFVDVNSDGAKNNNYIAMEANVGKQPFAINDTVFNPKEKITSKASGINGQTVTVGEPTEVSDRVKIELNQYPDQGKAGQELVDGDQYTMKTIVMKKNKDNPNGQVYQVFYTPFKYDHSKLQNVTSEDHNGSKEEHGFYYVDVKGKLDTSKLTEDDALVFYEVLYRGDVDEDSDHDKENTVTDTSINNKFAASITKDQPLDQLNDSAPMIDDSGRDAGLKHKLTLGMSVENDINDKDQTLTVEHNGKLHTTAWGSNDKAKQLGKTIEADKNQYIRDDIDLTQANLVNGKTYTIDKTVPVLPYKYGIVKDENEPIDFKDLKTPVTKMTVIKDAHGNKAIALPFKNVKVLRDSDAGSVTEPSGKQTDTVLQGNQFTYHTGMKTVSVLISGVDLSQYESGQKVVMFEDVAGQGIKPMVHADINDHNQTVTVKPKLHTNFENAMVPDGQDITKVDRSKIKYSKFYIPGKKVTLVDKVTFNGVKTGVKQTISGTVMTVDGSGKPVEYKDANGKAVKASVTFTPKTPNGTIDIPFTFVTNPKQITKLVAYERGTYEGEDQPYAVHEDINDQGQTVKPRKPSIATQAHTDTGKTFHKTTSTKMYDNIQMHNLNAGDSYKMLMKLWRVPGGDTKNAQIVYSSNKDFTANTDDEKAAISTIVDTSKDTPGTYYVWTEDLQDSKKPNNTLATHDDLNNKDQSVTLQETPGQSVPGQNTPFSQTGQSALWGLIILGAAAIAAGIYYERKRRQGTED